MRIQHDLTYLRTVILTKEFRIKVKVMMSRTEFGPERALKDFPLIGLDQDPDQQFVPKVWLKKNNFFGLKIRLRTHFWFVQRLYQSKKKSTCPRLTPDQKICPNSAQIRAELI